MTRNIGRPNQHRVLGDPKVRQTYGFGENEEMSRRRGLYFCKFSSEICNEDFLQASSRLPPLLVKRGANKPETRARLKSSEPP